MPPRGQWEVRGDTLGYADASGEQRVPSAEQVFALAVERSETVIQDLGDLNDELGLTFSETPLEVEVWIEPSPVNGSTGLRAEVVAVGPGVSHRILDAVNRTADHVVSKG